MSLASQLKEVMFQFGVASGDMYYSSYNLNRNSGSSQDFWNEIPNTSEHYISNIIGAVPFKVAEGTRYLFMFYESINRNSFSSRENEVLANLVVFVSQSIGMFRTTRQQQQSRCLNCVAGDSKYFRSDFFLVIVFVEVICGNNFARAITF